MPAASAPSAEPRSRAKHSQPAPPRKEVTVKSDLYSLGLVLYEIFTGKRPFDANTLAELVRAQSETMPVSPTSLVRDMDPVIERVILRCLDPDPARRPSSALAVAASLPGGDPLAAALAAGETPSPELVAAAGQGYALAHRIAIPLFATILVGLVVCAYRSVRFGALNRIGTVYSPEVLSLRASHVIQRLGYEGHDNDNAWGFSWDPSSLWYLNINQKPFPGWDAVLLERPSSLFVEGVLSAVPITTHPADWYFNSTVFMLGSIVALATWAFFTATAGQRLWKQDWFD